MPPLRLAKRPCLPPELRQGRFFAFPTLPILGAIPAIASLKAGQYYAHPQNALWRIMGELFGAGPSLAHERRVETLQSVGVASWASLQPSGQCWRQRQGPANSCQRENPIRL